MVSSATAEALPSEIVGIILSFLEDERASLTAAILVNKAWAEEGIKILWHYVSVERLASISLNRRQFYASRICALTNKRRESDDALNDRLRPLVFHRLRRLSLVAVLAISPPPSLQTVQLYDTAIDERLLVALPRNCPQLRNAFVHVARDGVESGRLTAFFTSCKILEIIRVNFLKEVRLSDELFRSLINRSGLKQLSLNGMLPSSVVSDTLTSIASTPTRFGDLRRLNIRVHSQAVLCIVTHFRALTNLSLSLEDNTFEAFSPIATLEHLTSLSVKFREDADLSSQGITMLQKLEKLRNLRLAPESPGDSELQCSTLSDEQFIILVSKLTELRTLAFYVKCTLSMSAISALGQHCPQLVNLQLCRDYDHTEWCTPQTTTHPELRAMWFRDISRETSQARSGDINEQAQTICQPIFTQAPKLQWMAFVEEDMLFQDEIHLAIEAHIRSQGRYQHTPSPNFDEF